MYMYMYMCIVTAGDTVQCTSLVNLACSSSSNTEEGCWVAAGYSRSSVVRASTAKVGGLGFDSQWLYPCIFSSACFYPDLPPVAVLITASCC